MATDATVDGEDDNSDAIEYVYDCETVPETAIPNYQ